MGQNEYAWITARTVSGPIGTWVKRYGGQTVRIADPARILKWSAERDLLYFVASNGLDLYTATAPDYQPQQLGQAPSIRSLHRAGASSAMPGCGKKSP